MSNRSTPDEACDAGNCSVPASRRQFLRDSFLSVAGALIATGMARSAAFAMPLQFTEPTRASRTMLSYAIPSSDGAQVDKTNEVILVRWQQAVYAFSLSCPHQNTALKWDEGDRDFQCPKHHSRFQPDGEYIADSGRATRNMDRFAITRDAAGLHVDLDKLYQQDTDELLWTAAVVKLP
ncbi:MAG: ubiquinol-cytochrome c reductase iron-sulfur subunit [Gemmatimonadaceae bacterium]